MGTSSNPSETELSAEEMENLREQGSEEPDEGQVADEQDPEDNQEIDETQRTEEERLEAERQSKEKVRTVPHQALHQERERRKGVEANFNVLNQRHQQLEGRFQQVLDMLNRQGGQQEEREQIPDRETQPFEYMAYQDKRLEALEKALNGNQQREQQSSQLTQALEQGNSLASTFRAEVGPEVYDNAFQFMYEQRYREYREMNYPEHQIAGLLKQEVQNGILAAMRNGLNPGEVLYKMAVNRGFVAKAKDPVTKLNNKQEALDRGKTLGAGAERKSVVAGSVEDIARMSDEDFEKFISTKAGKQKFRQAFTGN